MKTKILVLCAMMAAVTCALAPLSVNIGPVPLTLATFAVMMSGLLLGGRFGALSQLIYLLLGIAGLPVCAGWTPALPRLMGPTGGYLIGYIPLAVICGAIYAKFGRDKKGQRKFTILITGMLAGTAALYILGTAWFCAVSHTRVAEALTICVLPFLPGDALKIAAAAMLTPQLEKVLILNSD